MPKKKIKEDASVEKKSFWVTLPGIFTALATLITAIAGFTAALNTMFGTFLPKATTTPVPLTFTVSPVPVITDAPTAAAGITETPSPIPPPVFTTQFVLYSGDSPDSSVEQVEFDVEPGKLPAETVRDFLRLTRIAYGNFEPSGAGFDVQFVLHNTSDLPLILDLNERFFSLEDDRGQAAELAYFCCATRGGILPAGQDRTIQLFFRSPSGWSGKELSANYIFIRVNGLLPVIRASWKLRTLAVAN